MKTDVTIIGLGLIGASLGLAFKNAHLNGTIIGVDNEEQVVEKAVAIGAIDRGDSLESAVAAADVIIICTPLGTFPAILKRIKPVLKPGSIVTDAGSTKAEVMQLFEQLPSGVWAIGGHPMAGAELKGIRGADSYLFENAVYVLTPREGTPDHVIEHLSQLLTLTGARIQTLEAGVHDRLVAAVSHVPHLAAVALVNSTEGNSDSLRLAAGGFRDTTRIASSNPDLWIDILQSNRQSIIAGLETLTKLLTDLTRQLASGEDKKLLEGLYRARDIREMIPQVKKGLLPGFVDVICIVPDRPGIIGELGRILGEDHINIVDIEILRVREGDGGTIRLGVPNPADGTRAVDALQNYGIKAWLR